jgi:hypothetical protein
MALARHLAARLLIGCARLLLRGTAPIQPALRLLLPTPAHAAFVQAVAGTADALLCLALHILRGRSG